MPQLKLTQAAVIRALFLGVPGAPRLTSTSCILSKELAPHSGQERYNSTLHSCVGDLVPAILVAFVAAYGVFSVSEPGFQVVQPSSLPKPWQLPPAYHRYEVKCPESVEQLGEESLRAQLVLPLALFLALSSAEGSDLCNPTHLEDLALT